MSEKLKPCPKCQGTDGDTRCSYCEGRYEDDAQSSDTSASIKLNAEKSAEFEERLNQPAKAHPKLVELMASQQEAVANAGDEFAVLGLQSQLRFESEKLATAEADLAKAREVIAELVEALTWAFIEKEPLDADASIEVHKRLTTARNHLEGKTE